MSTNTTTADHARAEQSADVANNAATPVSLVSAMRRQRLQDYFFHKVTLTFALSVLIVLVGIIISLVIGAWPALKEFGPAFVTTVEWDPVNDQ
ncbi:phosphate ABC transporter permease subunit PstC, partial [Noviherbaspirillum sp. CPCC 100848]|nr:phosphate ABC transporter permease subunit PstC [Noviherbaspirillum sp. CPCC 100848]